ncbi:hypothetical protein Patl1_33169 [Pistacia atlantica]|uniref:Uncharacterized protein n=1 Tax=Pistacia atlantica TaxID=434234 RepID=A0ACC1AMN5_9ROSI|nr:hypothetical protein Patl1_33169 [Pistacia atlantica]
MLLRQRLTTLTRQCRHLSTSSSSTKIPLLYTHTNDNQNDAVTLQLLSWGRGASGQLGDGIEELWVWGKGDGGRLGFGHENSVFVPSLNPYLGDDLVQCVALGGVHSVALTSLGKIFTWFQHRLLRHKLARGDCNTLTKKFLGVLVVLVHLDILSIIESCFLDWWKVLGMGKFSTSQPVGHISQ